jgi:hypothetical protein
MRSRLVINREKLISSIFTTWSFIISSKMGLARLEPAYHKRVEAFRDDEYPMLKGVPRNPIQAWRS